MRKIFILLISLIFVGVAFGQSVEYHLIVENPHRNYFKIEITVDAGKDSQLEFKMPAWTPGSYHIGDWAKNVINVSAMDQDGDHLSVKKTDKQTWQIENTAEKKVKFTYNVYAYSHGNPYYAHIDNEFAYYNGSLVFMYVNGRKNQKCTLRYSLPAGWKYHTSLQDKENAETFSAPDYYTFIDCPAFLGHISSFKFEVDGKPHYVVMNAGYDYREQQISADLKTLVGWFKKMMGDLPYKHYTFFIRVDDPGRGGIEHLFSNVSCVKPEAINSDRDNSNYFGSLLMLEAHEYFHLWNVKRIRPTGLGPFDYEKEVYTKMLWVSEGFTSYYTHRPLSAAGIIKPKEVYSKWAAYYSGLINNSALHLKPVSQYSFDAWLESEIPDYSFRVYYAKGALIALMLDIDMRLNSDHQKNMDAFFKYLYDNNYKQGKTFNLDLFLSMLNDYSGSNYNKFFEKYVTGVEPIPFGEELLRVGLELTVDEEMPFLGLKIEADKKPYVKVSFVYPNSPADGLKIGRGDEIISINGRMVSGENWNNITSDLISGQEYAIQWFHANKLNSGKFTIQKKRTTKFGIQDLETHSEFINKWLMPE